MVQAELSAGVMHARHVRAVIFDFDGVIVDTEPLQQKAYIAAFAELGVMLSVNDLTSWLGHRQVEIVAGLARAHSLAIDLPALCSRRTSIYIDLLRRRVEPMPTAVEAVNLAVREGLICAIASSSGSAEIRVALEALDLSRCFSVVVTGEDVERPKPSPDVYDVAVERLGVRRDKCVAVEDSQIGLTAAIAAGLAVIAVPNNLTQTHDFARASARAKSVLEAVRTVVTGI